MTAVEPGGPAEQAGLQRGDIIMVFDGRQIDNAFELPELIRRTLPGTKVDVQVLRRGQNEDLHVIVGP